MWRKIRIGFLLVVLAIAAWSDFYDRLSTTDWDETLTVGVFPIEESDDAEIHRYIATLRTPEIADVEAFLNEQAAEYGVTIARPVAVQMFPPEAEQPPVRAPDAGMLSTMWWSIRMRLYAGRASRAAGLVPPQVRIFVRYHNPEVTQSVPHSVGMQKGLVGMVHAFADPEMRRENNVVIAHEILHTLGATDKYDPATLAPAWPAGYAEPDRDPRFPQPFTEIMAGRRAVSPTEFEMPLSLDEVVVGEQTAGEIRWVSP